MSGKCLIVDELHDNIHSLLQGVGIEYTYEPTITRKEIIRILPNYEGLSIRRKTRVDQELISTANLKYIARAGAGVDNLDEDFLIANGIEILNAPEGNRDSVGEHTIGLILNLLHNLHQANDEVREKQWHREPNRGLELGNMTVGIIGLGNSGLAVAKKLSGFGCQIIAYDKYLEQSTHPNYLTDLNTLFSEADILSLHIPLTHETRAMINQSFLEKFRKPIFFINVSRGEIAPLGEIRRALANGLIRKSALDVLECEKFNLMNAEQLENFNWLKDSGKVIFTPHIAGWTHESYARINEVLVEKIVHFLDKNTK